MSSLPRRVLEIPVAQAHLLEDVLELGDGQPRLPLAGVDLALRQQ